jgi:hypothetical protein
MQKCRFQKMYPHSLLTWLNLMKQVNFSCLMQDVYYVSCSVNDIRNFCACSHAQILGAQLTKSLPFSLSSTDPHSQHHCTPPTCKWDHSRSACYQRRGKDSNSTHYPPIVQVGASQPIHPFIQQTPSHPQPHLLVLLDVEHLP